MSIHLGVSIHGMESGKHMNTLTTALQDALAAAGLVSDALLSRHLATQLTSHPQQVAALRGLEPQVALIAASIVQQGEKTGQLGIWL